MSEERDDMMMRILESECMGYAYLHPSSYGPMEAYFISTTPENIANFVGSHLEDANVIIINDMRDRLMLEIERGFIHRYKERKLLLKIDEHLEPIRKGDKEPDKVLMMTRKEADEFFMEEDCRATMSECSMM